jgi:hypothetical protein
VCYDEKLCADFLTAIKYFNNLTCRHFNELGLKSIFLYDDLKEFVNDVKTQFLGCLVPTNEMNYCNYSTMYRCHNSTKCISKQRLMDGILNCPFNDDETFNESCSLNDIRQRVMCYENGHEKCFASLVIENRKKDCTNGEDEKIKEEKLIETHISFQMICDRLTELLPVLIDGKNETDETECGHCGHAIILTQDVINFGCVIMELMRSIVHLRLVLHFIIAVFFRMTHQLCQACQLLKQMIVLLIVSVEQMNENIIS